LVEVDAFNLCEPLSDEASLILLNTAIWALFDVENPLASNDLPSLRPRYNVIHVQVLLSLHLIIAGREPFGGIRASHGFVISLQLGNVGVGDIGTMTIGGDVVMRVVIRDRRMGDVLGMRGRGWRQCGSRRGRKLGLWNGVR
jgi:hypothetical protein